MITALRVEAAQHAEDLAAAQRGLAYEHEAAKGERTYLRRSLEREREYSRHYWCELLQLERHPLVRLGRWLRVIPPGNPLRLESLKASPETTKPEDAAPTEAFA